MGRTQNLRVLPLEHRAKRYTELAQTSAIDGLLAAFDIEPDPWLRKLIATELIRAEAVEDSAALDVYLDLDVRHSL